jgi:hypothetical protein
MGQGVVECFLGLSDGLTKLPSNLEDALDPEQVRVSFVLM